MSTSRSAPPAEGAKLACGGEKLQRPGLFFAPTVSSRRRAQGLEGGGLRAGGRGVAQRDIDEAIALANDTPFGLGAAAFTRDIQETERLVEELEAGQVFINGMVKSTRASPSAG